MYRVEKFICNCKKPPKEKIYIPLTKEEIQAKKEILQYILSNKNEVNYSERVFNKLEIILKELLGGK